MAALIPEGIVVAEEATPFLLKYAPAVLNYGSIVGNSLLKGVLDDVTYDYRVANNIPHPENEDKTMLTRADREEYKNMSQKIVGNLFNHGIVKPVNNYIKSIGE